MTTKPALLIVDDDPLIGESLSFALSADFDIRVCETRTAATDLLAQRFFAPRVALVDLGLPPLPDAPTEGFRLVSDLLHLLPGLRILILTGQNEASNARRALALGAFSLVPKPCEPKHLKRQLLAALQPAEAVAAVSEEPAQIIGDSAPIRRLRSQIDTSASSHYPALIEGESGSGKERVAASLHYLSARARLPFLALNCAAISANLVEPTLFGYAKGAFTGATNAKGGYFEEAGEGTLFLDEIGELPLELQPKLLRVLENGEFQRVGETQTRVSKARIIAATNRDLKAEVRAGRFRADLYHRLAVFAINVPPLRELGNDRLLLLEHYRGLYAGKPASPTFALSDEARALWQSYSFPGNVRELKNIVIRLQAKYAGYTVGEADLEAELTADNEAPPPKQNPRAEIEARLADKQSFNLDGRLAEIELQYIDAALAIAKGNMTEAARVLGVSRSTLYSRVEVLRASVAKAVG